MTDTTVAPIDAQQREQVIAETQRYVDIAARELEYPFAAVPVSFDLSGTTAGMFRGEGEQCSIRYNPWIFGKYFTENLRATVPHEVAHYVVHQLYGRRRVKPHGSEWRAVMALFGADDEVTFKLDLSGIPRRRQRTHPYRCACREHEVSTTRHNRIMRGSGRYLCRYCNNELIYCAED